jgi:hypothetical protein
MKLEFSRQIFDKISNIKFYQIFPVGAKSSHADGRTDVTKLSDFFTILRKRPTTCQEARTISNRIHIEKKDKKKKNLKNEEENNLRRFDVSQLL